jgi:hypothetical protein
MSQGRKMFWEAIELSIPGTISHLFVIFFSVGKDFYRVDC